MFTRAKNKINLGKLISAQITNDFKTPQPARRTEHTANTEQSDLCVGLQVVVEHVDGDGEVPGVERVRAVPTLRTKLAALGHHGMEVAQGKQDAAELVLPRAHLQGVLVAHVQREGDRDIGSERERGIYKSEHECLVTLYCSVIPHVM